MPTKKRRMMLSLPEELSHAFDEFRQYTGMAPSSFVVHLLMETLPVITALVEAGKTAATNQGAALDVLQRALLTAVHEGTTMQVELNEKATVLRRARSDDLAKDA